LESQNNTIIEQIKTHIELECLYKDFSCLMHKEIAQFLLNAPFLYARSLNESGNSFIRQIIFIFEIDRCVISFLTKKNSQEEKNLINDPMISLTTQVGFNSDPKKNFGLRIKAKTMILDSEFEKNNIAISLLRKYSSHLIKPEIVDLYSSDYDVVVNSQIVEIFQWNHNQIREFVCEFRKEVLII
jgi:hypothetical protein